MPGAAIDQPPSAAADAIVEAEEVGTEGGKPLLRQVVSTPDAVTELAAAVAHLATIVGELQGTLAVSGAVSVSNFPASQEVTGTVSVAERVTVDGTVAVSNLPATQTVDGTVALDAPSLAALETVSVANFPASQAVTGTFFQATQPVSDDFDDGQALAEQTGAGAVLTFTFASSVNLVVVESAGDGFVSRADPFGGTPTADLGVPCRHEVPTYLPVTTSEVKVYAPAGTSVNVWGFRR